MEHRSSAKPLAALICLAFTTLAPAIAWARTTDVKTVVSVKVSGSVKIGADRILDVVSTKAGDPFDPAKVQNDLRAIAKLGFFADQATPTIETVRGGVAITFRVRENPVVTAIRFTGNRTVPAETLLALMDTAPGQVFNVNTYRNDVLKINSYYDKAGFGEQIPSHVIDVAITPDGVLSLSLREGLTVRNIVITPASEGADPLLSPSLIRNALVTKPGNAYSEAQRDRDIEALKALYESHDLKLGDVVAAVDSPSIDQAAGTADVRYTISVLRVGAVEITGNTKTHDDVIRRELRLRPGMAVSESALRHDYERLNSLGFFSKVDFDAKPGPDPKRPALITVNWQVKEQRTGSATVGAGYSGGATGTGLTGNVAFSESNINGTGNGVSLKIDRGSQTKDAQLVVAVPHLGHTQNSQKYSLETTLFTQRQVNAYSVYQATGTSSSGSTLVTLVPATSNATAISGVTADYHTRASGVGATLGRRLNDTVQLKLGMNVQTIGASATVPSGYAFADGSTTVNGAFGVSSPAIASMQNGALYAAHSLVFGVTADTRDNVSNPRRGFSLSLMDEASNKTFGSDFTYQVITLDGARFFPVGRSATLGIHMRAGTTGGAVPATKLFTFSDQDLRGYSTVFYGTDMLLGQVELRIPLTSDRKFGLVTFVDEGATRIRHGTSSVTNADGTTTIYDLNGYRAHADAGIGLRFDIPQLGLKTLRLDFATGSQGFHTSFGIGQSF